MTASTTGRRGTGRGQRKAPARAAAPAELNTAEFVFEHNGEQYRLPSFTTIKAGLVRRVRNLKEVEQFFVLLEEVADADTLAAIDDMEMIELRDVMLGWQAHAQVGLGESSRSST